MRKPRILTWWSMRPRNSSVPSAQPAAPGRPCGRDGCRRLGPCAERIGDEALRRQLRPPPSSRAPALAADRRARRQPRCGTGCSRAGPARGAWYWRSADPSGSGARRRGADRVRRWKYVVFSVGPVDVEQPRGRAAGEHPPRRGAGSTVVAAGQQLAHPAKASGILLDHWCEQRRGRARRVVIPVARRAPPPAPAGDMDVSRGISTSRGAVEQRAPDLIGRGVEAETRRTARRGRPGPRSA